MVQIESENSVIGRQLLESIYNFKKSKQHEAQN